MTRRAHVADMVGSTASPWSILYSATVTNKNLSPFYPPARSSSHNVLSMETRKLWRYCCWVDEEIGINLNVSVHPYCYYNHNFPSLTILASVLEGYHKTGINFNSFLYCLGVSLWTMECQRSLNLALVRRECQRSLNLALVRRECQRSLNLALVRRCSGTNHMHWKH